MLRCVILGFGVGELADARYSGFPRLLESPGFFLLKIPGPGKSWKISLKVVHFSSGSNGKQAATV